MAWLALALGGSPAKADETRSLIALGQPIVPPEVPGSALRLIVTRIAEGLVESGLDVIVDPVPGGDCQDAACLRDMARAHRSDAIVLTRITSEGQNYRVQVQLVAGRTGLPVGTVERTCNFCAYDELATVALGAIRILAAEQRARENASRTEFRLHRSVPSHPGPMPWTAIGLGGFTFLAGALTLATDGGEADGRWPAVLTMAIGAALAAGGGAVILFWPVHDGRGELVGATGGVQGRF